MPVNIIRGAMAVLMAALSACETRGTEVEVQMLLQGSGLDGEVTTQGKLLTYGGGMFSLYPKDADPNRGLNGQCVALILGNDNARQAQQWGGRIVVVEGNTMPLSDIRDAIPSDFGTLNGRAWSGSNCETNSAIFVSRIRLVE
jgi:hypothetical protein